MIKHHNGRFFLQTKGSSYIFGVLPSGIVEHLYYGRHISEETPVDALSGVTEFLPGNSIASSEEGGVSEEELLLEVSSRGKGDLREPIVSVEFEDGSRTTDFRYADFEIREGKSMPDTLPGAYASKEQVTELRVRYRDQMKPGVYSGLELLVVYDVFEDCDVIVRRSILNNHSDQTIKIHRLLSSCVDFAEDDFEFHTFGGPWTREMEHFVHPITHGKVVNGSVCGVSSNRNNPFTFLSGTETTEEQGDCYGFNLIYSGNHYTCCERNALGSVRLVSGIHPEGFTFLLHPKESFESPEAVMNYSSMGYRGMSLSMHRFVREHIVRGTWKKKERPILLNSWEASYFKISESRLLRLARAAKKTGIELFVMDDGWFQNRNDDASSLGDWKADPKKLPGGLSRLSEKIREMGLQFGIWVEPEMVNENSDLYRAHPDWAIQIPGREQALGRHQMILDFTRKEVCTYIVEAMRNVFKESKVTYVKWDMNRIFSDVFSQHLPAEQQGEVLHRYIMGLYSVMEQLTREFPDILFEGCASGGCRFDLGILCYMPQIWASDDTDAYARAAIQNSLSYGYPQSVMGAHVSDCPNHQTLRDIPLNTRFAVASLGVLGYECNLPEMTSKEQKELEEQIQFYKEHRKLLQFGNFYRVPLRSQDARKSGQYQWVISDEKGEEAIGVYLQGVERPHTRYASFRGAGLQAEGVYTFRNLRKKYDIQTFGSLINTVSPVHVRQNSVTQKVISRVVRMDNEKEECRISGELLMHQGVRLKNAYAGVGYSDQVRLFKDYEARIYTMELEDK